MYSKVTAIETVYNGYRFRSRLEARWAVFFDAMGVKWEYEPEGFENEKGERYLPDFYLPEFDMWCEVKPNDRSRVNEVKKACSFVAKDLKIRALVFLPEIPVTSKMNSIFWYSCAYYNTLRQEPVICRVPFSEYTDYDCGGEQIMSIQTDLYIGNLKLVPIYACESAIEWDAVHDYDMPYDYNRATGQKLCWGEFVDTKRLNTAYTKARQARFEHGETPT